jgi:hypothetical protein
MSGSHEANHSEQVVVVQPWCTTDEVKGEVRSSAR